MTTSFPSNFSPDILRGKVAFVTGGGTGICKDIAETLLLHGCKGVAIVSRKLAVLEQTASQLTQSVKAQRAAAHLSTSGECLALAADVRVPEQIQKAVEDAVAKFGQLDILINGAAGNFLALASKMSYKAFKTVVEIDLIGTFNTSKAAYPHLCKTKGKVINISMTYQYTGSPLQSHAGSAKAGIDALTRHLAVEWGLDGVRVNCIAPGPIENTEGFNKLAPPDYNEKMLRSIPLGRAGKVREVSDSVIFLASDAATYISGHILVVDGGAWLTGSGLYYPDSVEFFKSKI